MLESRRSYGYYQDDIPHDTSKWQVSYRTTDGYYGTVGYVPLFKSQQKAAAFGEKFKYQNSWCKEIIIEHPAAFSSGY